MSEDTHKILQGFLEAIPPNIRSCFGAMAINEEDTDLIQSVFDKCHELIGRDVSVVIKVVDGKIRHPFIISDEEAMLKNERLRNAFRTLTTDS